MRDNLAMTSKRPVDISVIVATYNRADSLRATLRAFTRLEIGELTWELLVVDNNSADDTPAVCQAFADRLPMRYVFEGRQGQNYARLAALGIAAGELLVMTDDDVEPSANWLADLWAASRRHPEASMLCGPVTTEVPWPFDGTLAGSVPTCSFAWDGGEAALDDETMPISANLAFRRRVAGVLREVLDPQIGPRGGGRISGSETVALRALRQGGETIVYVPNAHVQHETPAGFHSVWGLSRRAYAQGRGDARVLHYGADAPACFGVPRFLYRVLIDDLLLAAAVLTVGRVRKSLNRFFHAVRTLGCIQEWRRIRRMASAQQPERTRCPQPARSLGGTVVRAKGETAVPGDGVGHSRARPLSPGATNDRGTPESPWQEP